MAVTNHHGMQTSTPKNAFCKFHAHQLNQEGRYGRLFPQLPPNYTIPAHLQKLGRKGGPMDGEGSTNLTQSVPLGMVFLGQFIDHDITFDTTSSLSLINQPEAIQNGRTPQLDLDCIFGGGPEDSPYLYTAAGGSRELYLITGATNGMAGQRTPEQQQDLARNGLGTAVIGDPRNDENRIISQLQLAFIRFYNALYQDLIQAHPQIDRKLAYEQARQGATWHYQWIVVNEFLPTLCGQLVVDEILANGRRFYQARDAAFIPVEFSVAAYRFGHSMIAQRMRINAAGPERSVFAPEFGRGFSPLRSMEQVVDWKYFFDYDGSFQRAEKLDTKLPSGLLDLPFISSPDPADRSLATRNLRRGQSFLLPSGENVARFMERPATEIDAVSHLVSRISAGLGGALSKGTPLWLYILAEAELIGRIDRTGHQPGEGLGPLGAVLVAETLLGLLELDEHSYLGSNRDWFPSLAINGEFKMTTLLDKAQTAA